MADGITDPGFDMRRKGKYVDAAGFNRLTDDPATIVVDMRNHYEYEVGHFDEAIEVPSDTFREQLPKSADLLKDKKESPIIMYCTGGIRCEKASAWLLHQGFKNVYHLEGGIIHYANTVRERGWSISSGAKILSLTTGWGSGSASEIIAICHQCGRPADTHTNCRNEGCHLLFIQCAECAARLKAVAVLIARQLSICRRLSGGSCGKEWKRIGILQQGPDTGKIKVYLSRYKTYFGRLTKPGL